MSDDTEAESGEDVLLSDAGSHETARGIFDNISAVLSLDEVRRMCNELFEVNKDYLGDYK